MHHKPSRESAHGKRQWSPCPPITVRDKPPMNFGGEHSAHRLRYGQAPRGRRSGASGWLSAPAPKRAQGGVLPPKALGRILGNVATPPNRIAERMIRTPANTREASPGARATTAKMDEGTRQPLRILCVASQRLSSLPKPYGALSEQLRVNFRLPLQ